MRHSVFINAMLMLNSVDLLPTVLLLRSSKRKYESHELSGTRLSHFYCEEPPCLSTHCFDSQEANMLTPTVRMKRRSSGGGGGSCVPPWGAPGDIVWFQARGELWRGGNICCPRGRQTVMDGQVCSDKCVKECVVSAPRSGTQKTCIVHVPRTWTLN